MQDNRCVDFLRWALPQLNLRWQGFRRVRRQVCRRLDRRLQYLELGSIDGYRRFILDNPAEWEVLDRMCRITISRFYRDRKVFACFSTEVLPQLTFLARRDGSGNLRIWNGGSASGEEPYTVAIAWHHLLRPENPDIRLDILASESDPAMIKRAQAARYPDSSLRTMPDEWRQKAFARTGEEEYTLRQPYRQYVRFRQEDIRNAAPEGKFHAVFCRNLAFTYFSSPLQDRLLAMFAGRIVTGGALVIGGHERLPVSAAGFEPWIARMPIYRKR